MDIITFMVTVFYYTDNWLAGKQVRQRGPQPSLSDSEVLTMEIVGEFLSLDEDQAIYCYFQRHWADWFPTIRQVHRTTFVRQAANLWKVKEQLWQYVLSQIEYDPQVAIVDSFPVPVCRFARAYRCRLFQAQAAYGYDELAKQTFYGFRAHVLAVLDLTEGTQGWVTGIIGRPLRRNSWPNKTCACLPRTSRVSPSNAPGRCA